MAIQLSDHFTYKRLMRFTLPSIAMMVFSSVYGVVDGFFVSNFVGKTPFAAVNFIMPVIMILAAFGFMFGTGGSALIAKTLGEGNTEKAKRLFSMIIYISLTCGIVLTALGIIFIRPIAAALGAEGELLENCVLYGRIILAALPIYMLQMEFQSFMITAEKPQFGLFITLAAGITNMVFDALFIAVLDWGLIGAASATALSMVVGGIIPLIYFIRPNSSLFRLGKTNFDGKALLKVCTNGSSELMTNISMSLVGMLYNMQLLKYAGENGVAAYGVLMYVGMIFWGIFMGYSFGSAPIISYHYGAENSDELKNLLKKSAVIISISSVCMFIFSEIMARPLASIFVSYDKELLELTLHGFFIYSFSFLFAGFAIFLSSFFTALNNGLISAVISFLRTLVFEAGAVMFLPLVLKLDGIWCSVVVAEFMAVVIGFIFLLANRRKYKYM